MIRASALFPNTEGATFDMNYFLETHMPMARRELGSAVLKEEIWSGLSAPGLPRATYLAILHMYFKDLESFAAAFAGHDEAIMADLAEYTNVQPILQLDVEPQRD